MTDDTNVNRNISESADKIRVETQVKRGSETWNEDRVKVQIKGNDPDDVVERLNATIENLRETADTVRSIQPGADDE